MKLTHCKLSKNTQRKLLEYFVLEVTARSAADLLGIQPNSAALFYRKIRTIIAYHLELEADEVFEGHVELDESYFGGARKGKRGRGAAGKTAVFGILKRGGKVYTKVVVDTKASTLMHMVFTCSKQSRMVDSLMIKAAHIQSIVTAITISINHAVRRDSASNNEH